MSFRIFFSRRSADFPPPRSSINNRNAVGYYALCLVTSPKFLTRLILHGEQQAVPAPNLGLVPAVAPFTKEAEEHFTQLRGRVRDRRIPVLVPLAHGVHASSSAIHASLYSSSESIPSVAEETGEQSPTIV